MNRLSNGERDDLGAELRKAAAGVWKRNENGILQVDLSPTKIASVKRLSQALVHEDFCRLGLKNCFSFYSSEKTDVFTAQDSLGRQFVLRDGDVRSGRSDCPINLQPFKQYRGDKRLSLELMPLVPITLEDGYSPETKPDSQISTYDIPRVLVSSIQKILIKESWDSRGTKDLLQRDIGIFPNGTPVQVDPDVIRRDRTVSKRDNHDKLKHLFTLQNDLNLPPEMHYVDRDGITIQEKIFPNPF